MSELRTAPEPVASRPAAWPGDRLLRLLLLVVLVPYYAAGLASDGLTDGDEAYWISAGWRATSLLFVEHKLIGPAWQTGAMASVLDLHHPTETAANRNPKLGPVIIGAGVRWLGAPRPPAWQKDYAFHESPEWNRRRGLLPSRATLLAARLPVAALSIGAALWLFSILRTLVGPGWAFVGALLVATSPLITLHCRRAMLDGPAYAFSIGAVLWTIRACGAPDRWGPLLAAGSLACAALSSKLNAGILLPIMVLALSMEALLQRRVALLARAVVTGVLAFGLFVALNPTLYIATHQGILSMLRIGSELGDIGRYYSSAALPTLGSRVEAAYQLLLAQHGMAQSRLSLPVDALLLLVGAGVLATRARGEAAARIVLIWLVIALVSVCVWPPVRWDRYFLPAMAPIGLVEVLGLAFGLSPLGRWGARALLGIARAPA